MPKHVDQIIAENVAIMRDRLRESDRLKNEPRELVRDPIDDSVHYQPKDMTMTKYEKRVLELEAEGLTTSDAQSVADVEFIRAAAPEMLEALNTLRDALAKDHYENVSVTWDAEIDLIDSIIAKARGEV